MTRSLTLQTEREIRYEQRCQRKKIEQQKLDRVNRIQNRENNRSNDIISKSEIVDEVSNEINTLIQKRKRNITNRYSNFVSFFY
jgi:hypothetical protein